MGDGERDIECIDISLGVKPVLLADSSTDRLLPGSCLTSPFLRCRSFGLAAGTLSLLGRLSSVMVMQLVWRGARVAVSKVKLTTEGQR